MYDLESDWYFNWKFILKKTQIIFHKSILHQSLWKVYNIFDPIKISVHLLKKTKRKDGKKKGKTVLCRRNDIIRKSPFWKPWSQNNEGF